MNQQVTQRSNFQTDLDNYESQIAAALPSHISVDKFKRVATTAVSRNPDLYLKGDKRALFNACVQCASDGLLPDGREAALVMFKGKPQYLPMVAGVIKRMRNSGEVIAVDSQVIHQNDHFDYQLGDDARITHKPTLGDPGKIIGAYAIITLSSGEKLREVMSVAQIDKVRAVSKATSPDSPWNQWYGEMSRKTALKRCAKRAPTTPDLERLMNRDAAFDAPDTPALPPPRPTRQSIAAPANEPVSCACGKVDDCSYPKCPVGEKEAALQGLGHDATTAETVDADGVIHDTSAPSAGSTDSTVPSKTPAEATQAPAQAEGAQVAASDGYDAERMRKALWEGALAEDTFAGLKAYWAIQDADIKVLKRVAPEEYSTLYDAVSERLKVLRNERPA